MQRFKFTGKGSLNFWSAYILEYLNTGNSLPLSTESNSNTLKNAFLSWWNWYSELSNCSFVICVQPNVLGFLNS